MADDDDDRLARLLDEEARAAEEAELSNGHGSIVGCEITRRGRTFRVIWSEEDGEFVGLCEDYPSLSWLVAEEDAALVGILKLVAEVDADIAATGS